jgi:hypothetical protein
MFAVIFIMRLCYLYVKVPQRFVRLSCERAHSRPESWSNNVLYRKHVHTHVHTHMKQATENCDEIQIGLRLRCLTSKCQCDWRRSKRWWDVHVFTAHRTATFVSSRKHTCCIHVIHMSVFPPWLLSVYAVWLYTCVEIDVFQSKHTFPISSKYASHARMQCFDCSDNQWQDGATSSYLMELYHEEGEESGWCPHPLHICLFVRSMWPNQKQFACVYFTLYRHSHVCTSLYMDIRTL